MGFWAAAIPIAMSALDTLSGAKSQRDANAHNIKLQRQQQEWEERMSNSAVQRRARDIEQAGGNRALAFINGDSASTPTIAPARVEPTYKGGGLANIATALQLKKLQADTELTTQQARVNKVEADIREKTAHAEGERRLNRQVEEYEWDDAKTHIMRNQVYTSAAERKKTEGTVDALIQTAKQQAREGKLNLDALENIAKIGGLEASKTKDLLKIIIDIWRTAK